MELDQATRRIEIEMTHLKNDNEKLQTDLLKKNIQYDNLEEDMKKLQSMNKNIDIINREKLVEYEKKMATLNQ